MTQREALKNLLFMIKGSGYKDPNGDALQSRNAVLAAQQVLARNDELTLEEVRLLLIKDDERAGFHQEVVIRVEGLALNRIENHQQLYATPAIPPHGADGAIPAGGHKDIPGGQAPSMDGLRTMLDR